MSLSAFQARAYQSSHPWAVEFIHEPRYLKSVTVSRVLPLCICGGGAEKELQVNTLMFCSLTTSRTSLHFSSTGVNPIRPGLFLGGRRGAWARGEVPVAHISKTIEHIGMEFGGLKENKKLINLM